MSDTVAVTSDTSAATRLPHKPMMHDFALTGKYVVLFDLPVTFSMAAVTGGSPLPYTWNPEVPARVGLLPRDGTAGVRWLDVEPCWVFHTFNAYDDEAGRVVVDLIQYQGAYDVSVLDGKGPLALYRWTIDPAAGKVIRRQLDRLQEFPRVDERAISRPHRYGYSAVIRETSRATLYDLHADEHMHRGAEGVDAFLSGKPVYRQSPTRLWWRTRTTG